MPVLQKSTYQRPWYLFNPHIETIYPALTRRISGIEYERERLTLSDGDFVDLDWIDSSSRQLVVLTHGLEGDTSRHYIKGMARRFMQGGWDVLAWNCRSCSGEMNRAFRMYNHGEVGDIGEVLRHAMRTKDYERVVMVGFSMGGNITMKYLGVNADHLDAPIYRAVAFSAPCDLGEGAELLDWPENKFYRNRFFKMLRKKITEKAEQYPGRLDITKFDEVKVWKDFDNFFSAPINGYKDADDFYRQGSAINFMGPINVPVLLVNALNDPILSPNCYPKEFCEQHAFIYLETPQHGGHVGFSGTKDGFNWAERRAWTFVTEH